MTQRNHDQTEELSRTASRTARQAEHFSLDYATWRARIAAPGSRFDSGSSASARIIQLDAASRRAISADDVRRTA